MASSTTNLMGESRIFAPYRALGLICGHVPVVIKHIAEAKMTKIYAAVGNFLHVYNASNLGLTAVSAPLPSEIDCLAIDHRYAYVGFETKVAVMHHERNVKRIFEDHESPVRFLLPFGEHLIVIDRKSTVKIWEIDSGDAYGEWRLGGAAFEISAICHPSTYLNKILLGSKRGALKLFNIKTGKVVFEFDGWDSEVTCLEQSTAIDVIGIGLKDGRIFLHNIKFNETIVAFRQDWGSVTSITFRTDGPPLMVTGSSAGHAAIWDLEKRKLFNQILDAHRSTSSTTDQEGGTTGISTLIALQNEPAVLSSGGDNSLKMWVFDLSDGGARLLCSQEGHGKPPTFLRFHGGERGQYVISAGGDSDVKMFHTTYASKNRNLGEAGAMRKKIAKKKKLNWEDVQYPPVTYMASDAARESGWDNIVCCHKDRSMVTTWTSRRSKLGSHKLRHERFNMIPEWRKSVATCCTVSSCGNFALIGYSSGHVDMFNIQSGLYRGSFIDASKDRAHTASINGICSDGLNECVFTGCADGKLKFWRFGQKKQLLHTMQLSSSSGVTRMCLHRDNDLLAVGCRDSSLLVIDVECRRVVRLFENAHRDHTITDLAFTPNGQWVITAGTDAKAKVWDLPSANLVDVMRFPTSCTGLTISSNGEYLATAHSGKVGVYLWVNKTLYSPYMALKPLAIDYEPSERMLLPSSETVAAAGRLDDVGEEPMDEDFSPRPPTIDRDQLDPKLATYSGLPQPRWAYLLDIDVIKERNKPIQPPKKPEKAPFFLPTVAGVVPTFDDATTSKDDDQAQGGDQSSSRIFSEGGKSFDPKSEFARKLDAIDCEDTKSCENVVVDLFKRQSPAGVEIELRNLSPINGGSIDLMKKFLTSIERVFETKRNFEIANSYLALFVKLHRDVLWTEMELREVLERTKKTQKETWTRMDDLLNDTLCLVQYLKSSVL